MPPLLPTESQRYSASGLYVNRLTFILDYHINNLTEFFCGPGAGLVILELISPLHILKRATR